MFINFKTFLGKNKQLLTRYFITRNTGYNSGSVHSKCYFEHKSCTPSNEYIYMLESPVAAQKKYFDSLLVIITTSVMS